MDPPESLKTSLLHKLIQTDFEPLPTEQLAYILKHSLNNIRSLSESDAARVIDKIETELACRANELSNTELGLLLPALNLYNESAH